MRRAIGGALIAVCVLVGCSNGGGDTTTDGTATDDAGSPELAAFQVEVKDGEVVGGVEREEVALNSTVRITVMSDVADEIHVHGYDEKMEIGAGGTVELTFEADAAGVFEVELEEAKVHLLELEVR